MRPYPNSKIERYRHGDRMSQRAKDTNNGYFTVKTVENKYLFAIASDGGGWDHVSVSVLHESRCPTWEEMCFVKDLFWSENEPAMQLHPVKKDYINNHPHCLHLWRPQSAANLIPLPPSFMVGTHGVEGLTELGNQVMKKEQQKLERTIDELQQASDRSGWGW